MTVKWEKLWCIIFTVVVIYRLGLVCAWFFFILLRYTKQTHLFGASNVSHFGIEGILKYERKIKMYRIQSVCEREKESWWHFSLSLFSDFFLLLLSSIFYMTLVLFANNTETHWESLKWMPWYVTFFIIFVHHLLLLFLSLCDTVANKFGANLHLSLWKWFSVRV